MKIPHKRELKTAPGGAVYSERRGVLSFDLEMLDAGTVAGGGHVSILNCRTMARDATALVEGLGFETPEQIERRTSGRKSNRSHADRMAIELAGWCGAIGAKHGALSIPAIAANFLGSLWAITARDAAGDRLRIEHVLAFAEAYRAFHFERFGDHGKAFKASRVTGGSVNGVAATAKKMAAQDGLISNYCRQQIAAKPELEHNASALAAAIFEQLSHSFVIRGLPAISLGQLRRREALMIFLKAGGNGEAAKT